MPRALLLVLDSVGIGAAPDADLYGDHGADTIGHITKACAKGDADRVGLRSGPIAIPNLVALGLGEACRIATNRVPIGLDLKTRPRARFGSAIEVSKGKDTPSGHWELAGVPVHFDWGYFPRSVPCFPPALIERLCEAAELPGILGNRHASGVEIIAELGDEHIRSGKPICYTSADSVFQIAAHENAFGLQRLYETCAVARTIFHPLRIGRIIARPFSGDSSNNFIRTGNRRDYAIPPPSPTLLEHASSAGRPVISIGKIADIFAHTGTGREIKANGNASLFDNTLSALSTLDDGGLIVTNFIDFDSLYGHRRDVAGYAAALEQFDSWLPRLFSCLKPDDLVLITADHGCDPTWHGSDHTREQVPVLAFGPNCNTGSIGQRSTLSDVAATIAMHLHLENSVSGTPF